MAFRKILGGIVGLGAIGAGAFVFLTAPERLPAAEWASAGEPDLANGGSGQRRAHLPCRRLRELSRRAGRCG